LYTNFALQICTGQTLGETTPG